MKRIEYIDAIKGFAIILMVMGHVIAWNYSDYELVCTYSPNSSINVKWGGVIWQLIYSFHMPLFFMISGFLSYKECSWQDFAPFLFKKVSRLLFPWICTFGIVFLLRGSMGYWFLLCLFQISIIGFLLMKFLDVINSKNHIIVDIVVVCLFYYILGSLNTQDWHFYDISLGRFYGAYLPFFVGMLLRKYGKLFTITVENPGFYTYGLIAFVLIFISRYMFDYGKVFQLVYHHGPRILSILGSLLVIHVFAGGLFSRFSSLLIYIGQKTLPIYVLHIMFVLQIPSVGDYILSQNAETSIVLQICYFGTITAISIILSLLAYKILSMSTLLRKALFGE